MTFSSLFRNGTLTQELRETLMDRGVPSQAPECYASRLEILTAENVRDILPKRYAASHKGSYGKLLAAAGSPGMMGAASFCVKAACRMGTGLVRALIPESEFTVMTLAVPEAVLVREIPSDSTAVILGPGLGKDRARFEAVLEAIPPEIPMVVDADGLNLLAETPLRRGNWILTPHMGEASRLSGLPIGALMADPFAAAEALAERYAAVVVLKGAASVIADGSGSGRLAVNLNGNPGMSTAGSGDVLTGILGGLIAQYSPADLYEKAAAGVWLHGAAGDRAARETGLWALMASDMISALKPDRLIED